MKITANNFAAEKLQGGGSNNKEKGGGPGKGKNKDGFSKSEEISNLN